MSPRRRERARCPICHGSVASLAHITGCVADSEEVLEVRPPHRVRRDAKSGPETVESVFFPLVSAAHEFKTPLVVMLGYADLLRSGGLGPVNDKQLQVLGEIHESAERLQGVIQD